MSTCAHLPISDDARQRFGVASVANEVERKRLKTTLCANAPSSSSSLSSSSSSVERRCHHNELQRNLISHSRRFEATVEKVSREEKTRKRRKSLLRLTSLKIFEEDEEEEEETEEEIREEIRSILRIVEARRRALAAGKEDEEEKDAARRKRKRAFSSLSDSSSALDTESSFSSSRA